MTDDDGEGEADGAEGGLTGEDRGKPGQRGGARVIRPRGDFWSRFSLPQLIDPWAVEFLQSTTTTTTISLYTPSLPRHLVFIPPLPSSIHTQSQCRLRTDTPSKTQTPCPTGPTEPRATNRSPTFVEVRFCLFYASSAGANIPRLRSLLCPLPQRSRPM